MLGFGGMVAVESPRVVSLSPGPEIAAVERTQAAAEERGGPAHRPVPVDVVALSQAVPGVADVVEDGASRSALAESVARASAAGETGAGRGRSLKDVPLLDAVRTGRISVAGERILEERRARAAEARRELLASTGGSSATPRRFDPPGLRQTEAQRPLAEVDGPGRLVSLATDGPREVSMPGAEGDVPDGGAAVDGPSTSGFQEELSGADALARLDSAVAAHQGAVRRDGAPKGVLLDERI